ncbi:MAG: hypothetical protein U0520_00760 [Candidatus Saccharimonadales bacterium]
MKEELALSARVAFPASIGGLKEKVARPEYATAVGLMLLDVHKDEDTSYGGRGLGGRLQHSADQARNLFQKSSPVSGSSGRFRIYHVTCAIDHRCFM